MWGVGSVQQRSSTGDAPTAFDAQIIFSIPLQAFICVRACSCVRAYVCRITISRFLEIRPKNVARHLWLIVSVQLYGLFYFLTPRVLTDGVLKKERYGFWIRRCIRYRRRHGAILRTAGVKASEISCVNFSIECPVPTIMFLDFSSNL
jgi:hypothetical protein